MGLGENDKSIRFDLPGELKEQAEHSAARADLSMAQLLRALLRAHLGGQGYVQGQGLERRAAPDDQ